MILRKASLLKVGDKIHVRWWNEVRGTYHICKRRTGLSYIYFSVISGRDTPLLTLTLLPDDLVEVVPEKG